MPELVDPAVRLRTSFLAAVAEFRADGDFPVPWFVTEIDPAALTDAAGFSAYISRLLNERQGGTQAVLTCDDTNTASRRVIEANGGRFIDMAGRKRRYRVPTS